MVLGTFGLRAGQSERGESSGRRRTCEGMPRAYVEGEKQVRSVAADGPHVGQPVDSALLIPENKIHAQAANFDRVPIIQSQRPRDGRAVDRRHFVARPNVISVITLIDLRRQLRLEPAF